MVVTCGRQDPSRFFFCGALAAAIVSILTLTQRFHDGILEEDGKLSATIARKGAEHAVTDGEMV